MKTTHEIDFPHDGAWFTGPLPESPTVASGWRGLEEIMPALVKLFCRDDTLHALELGVEYGYSAAVLAQLFHLVIGVDTFLGDCQSTYKQDHSGITRRNLERWPNVVLVQSDYRDFIASHSSYRYSLIHVDMLHDTETTYRAGMWAAEHAPVVLFHDMESWPEVKPAVMRIAEETGREVYLYKPSFGLGIMV